MKKNRKIWKGAALSILLAVSLLTGCAQGAAKTESTDQPSKADAEETVSVQSFEKTQAQAAQEKEETVSVTADASGNVKKVEVSALLKQVGTQSYVLDSSSLRNIKNKEGDEEYQQNGTELLWENHGSDISYQGESEKKPDVGVSVLYYLDGKEISPEKIAGASGRVKIRFNYQNRQTQEHLMVPYLFLTMLTLDSENFSDIQVKNGIVSSMGDLQLIAGYAVPGLKEAMGLQKIEAAEDLKLPEYVEVTADTTDFQLDFTTTIVTGGLFRELDTDKLKDGDDLVNSMKELKNASAEIMDGISKLSEGSGTFQDALKQYTEGAEKLSEGAKELAGGMETLESNGTALVQGAEQLSKGLQGLKEALDGTDATDFGQIEKQLTGLAAAVQKDGKALSEGLGLLMQTAAQTESQMTALMETFTASKEALGTLHASLESLKEDLSVLKESGADTTQCEAHLAEASLAMQSIVSGLEAVQLPDLSGLDLSDIQAAAEDLGKQMETLQSIGENIGSDDLKEQTEQLQSAVSSLSEGAAKLEKGIALYSGGVSQAAEGTRQLKSGAGTLGENGSSLLKGFETLAAGMHSLADGYGEFDRDGIQELSKLAGDDLADVLQRIRTLKKTDNTPRSFSGCPEETKSSVRYVIETAEIHIS